MHVTLEQAAKLLKTGQVAAVPTETVYGLAASISSPSAISQLFSLKGRPANNPLIVHLANASQIHAFAETLPEGGAARQTVPGPLTLVVHVKKGSLKSPAPAGRQPLSGAPSSIGPGLAGAHRTACYAIGKPVGHVRDNSRPC